MIIQAVIGVKGNSLLSFVRNLFVSLLAYSVEQMREWVRQNSAPEKYSKKLWVFPFTFGSGAYIISPYLNQYTKLPNAR